jgi:hypothetical protein
MQRTLLHRSWLNVAESATGLRVHDIHRCR